MPDPTIGIDSGTLTNQPSGMMVTEAEAVRRQTANGGYLASVRTKGVVVRLTWGIGRLATLAAMAELRTARGGTVAHTLQWTDPGGTAHDIKVLWLSDPPYGIVPKDQYDRFSITLYERPD